MMTSRTTIDFQHGYLLTYQGTFRNTYGVNKRQIIPILDFCSRWMYVSPAPVLSLNQTILRPFQDNSICVATTSTHTNCVDPNQYLYYFISVNPIPKLFGALCPFQFRFTLNLRSNNVLQQCWNKPLNLLHFQDPKDLKYYLVCKGVFNHYTVQIIQYINSDNNIGMNIINRTLQHMAVFKV